MLRKSGEQQYHSFIGSTLAEENLYGFSFKKSPFQKDSLLDPYNPQRIELPLYFNTPKRRDNLINLRRYRNQSSNKSMNSTPYLNNQSALNMSCSDSCEQLLFKKRLRDYKFLASACKRGQKSRV